MIELEYSKGWNFYHGTVNKEHHYHPDEYYCSGWDFHKIGRDID